MTVKKDGMISITLLSYRLFAFLSSIIGRKKVKNDENAGKCVLIFRFSLKNHLKRRFFPTKAAVRKRIPNNPS